jgi:hypothetical protein
MFINSLIESSPEERKIRCATTATTGRLNEITCRNGVFSIPKYEAVKAGRSEAFRRVGDFYRHHGTYSIRIATIDRKIALTGRGILWNDSG